MDRQLYILHARQKLIQEATDTINALPNDEILHRMCTCPKCFEVDATEIDMECAIAEAITAQEVDDIIGVDSHCDNIVDADSDYDDDDDDELDVDMSDTGVSFKPDTEEDEDEENIASEFRGAIDRLCDKGEVALMVAYVYTSEGEQMSKTVHFKGKTFIFGNRQILDVISAEVLRRMDENTGDDGIVMDLDGENS